MAWCRTCRRGCRGSSDSAGLRHDRGARRGERRRGLLGTPAGRAPVAAGVPQRRARVAGLLSGPARYACLARPGVRSPGRGRSSGVGGGDAFLLIAGAGTRRTRTALDTERPPSRLPRSDSTEGLGGRVAAGNSPARAVVRQALPGAASSQPPHMSICHSISRTTSFPVYRRRYSRNGWATRQLICQRSLPTAASTNAATSSAIGAAASATPSRVCTRAASVTLDTNQTPCAACRSAGRSAW